MISGALSAVEGQYQTFRVFIGSSQRQNAISPRVVEVSLSMFNPEIF
jgi:hypothetical protein